MNTWHFPTLLSEATLPKLCALLYWQAFTLSQSGQVIATRMQLPLSLGWAISVHKSQGMTLDRVEMDLQNVFENGQMYVALSRASSLEGLSLRNVDWSKLRAHPRVLEWHRRVHLVRQTK